jgi:tRNA A-37 threonylcarbamoyl transferase component Bud32
MTPERWQQVKEVFSAASVLAAEEQRAYLEQACGNDAELRSEVDSLLDAHSSEDAVLDRPATSYLSSEEALAAADPWLRRRVGPYELVALIGRGGMGAVYRARRVDAEYEKEVAIKLVPAGYHVDYVLQRLRAERQILANLDHPNIARLIDGGATDDGLPYLVMELVDGEPLDHYCGGRNLSLRDRLRLFREVCAAVSYAHQRLVIHRDLKPGNILVTADGTVKLLDFGIAKLTQPAMAETSTAPTVTLMQALTPGFSSPEQILGKTITTTSDVYSLGVVLYLLLTGRSPYATRLDTAQDAIRQVCEVEPALPSAHSGHLDRDLDAITMYALRKEPERRYRSVDEFSEDIRRYLEGRPVTARGDQFSYRAGKLIRRRKLEIAAAGLIGLTLVGGVVASVRQARIAEEQRVQAEQQRERAERHFASVRKLADAFMFQVHDAIENLPGSTAARELLVNTALEYLNTLANEAGGDIGLQHELGNAYRKVADIQGQAYGASKGQPRAALESYTKSVALLEPVVAADPANRQAQTSLAQSLLQQSRLFLLLGEPDEATKTSRRTVAMYEALAADRSDTESRKNHANALSVHSYNMDMGGKQDAGIPFARKAIAILEELVREHPKDSSLLYQLSVAYSALGNVLPGPERDPARIDEALELTRKALEIDEPLAASTGGRNRSHVHSLLADHINLALLLNEKGRYVEALTHIRAAEPWIASMLADKDDKQVPLDATFLDWHGGRALLGLGRYAEAERTFARSYASLQKIASESDTLQVQYLLGGMAWGQGEANERQKRWAAAKEWYETAIPHFNTVTADVDLDYLDQIPITRAIEGLARSKAELARQ